MATVLINSTVKKYLLGLPRSFRERAREKFEFLESGLWEGKIRAKKLRTASSKCVFEAPLDKDKRLLFTLGNYGKPAKKDLVVYVWGVVAHDELSRMTRTIVPGNVPFLRFKDFRELRWEDVDLEKLEPSCFTQEQITEKAKDESGSQRWYPVDNPEWERIQRYTRDDFELFLYLSPEQKSVLESPLPVLVSGTAGSGKTTLSVYYLLKSYWRRKKKVFITYNRSLRNFAEKLYRGLLNEAEWRRDAVLPDFHAYKDFILEIALRFGKAFSPEKEVDFNRFSRMFASHPLQQSFDSALVWEEIRSIIKGALPQVNVSVLERAAGMIRKKASDPGLVGRLQQQFILFSKLESLKAVESFVEKHLRTNISSFSVHLDRYLQDETFHDRILSILGRTLEELQKRKDIVRRKHLSFLEYELLGKKKAPNFRFNRKEIYRIFEWYQDRLESDGLWDELDLTREVLRAYSEKNLEAFTYDVLACDEVQDLADIQINLLFDMVHDPMNVFFAGDTKQTINPSGFRWEEVKRQFYERGLEVPEVRYLILNFRSSGSIVELSNILLGLKEKYLGTKAEEVPEDWKYKGRPAAVVTGIGEKDMLEILRAAGARRTILVRTEAEKMRLQRLLETELVFTIAEAKGLEFDTVVLWKFCDDQFAEDVWKIILDLSKKSIHEAKIKHEINLLYVGITRSRNDLIVYDGGRPSLIWENPQFRGRVFTTDDRSFINGVWNVLTSSDEWIEQGHYFFEKEFYRAAMECYKNGGDLKLLTKASAYASEKEEKYGEAALDFEKIGEFERSAHNYEKAGEFEKALFLWEKLRNEDRAFLCRVEVFKREGQYGRAGDLYLERGMYQEAIPCFRRAGEYQKLAAIYLEHLKNIKEAAACLEQSRDLEKAAGLYVRLKSFEKAADLYSKSGNYALAEVLWKKVKNVGRLVELYEKTGQSEKLLSIYEKKKDFEKATKCLKAFKDKSSLAAEAETLFVRRKYFPSLVRFFVLEDHKKTAECYLRLKKYEEAVRHFKLAGDFHAAGITYEKLKDYKSALENYLNSEEGRKGGFPLAAKIARRIPDDSWVYRLGKDLFDGKRYREALAIFSFFRNALPEVGICYTMLGEEEKAFQAWAKSEGTRDYARIAEMCIYSNAVGVAAKFFLSHQKKGRPDLDWASRSKLRSDFVVKLFDLYFAENPNPEEMRAWGHVLGEYDFKAEFWEKVLHYLERGGDYNFLLDYFRAFKLLDEKRFQAVKAKFQKQIPEFVKSENWEGLALRYFVLDRTEEFNEILPKIRLSAHNLLYYLCGEDRFYREGLAWCEKNNLLEEAGGFFPMMGTYERTAEIFERSGNLSKAADYYFHAGQFEKAASLYSRLERFALAGDAFFRKGDYRAALEMYKKQTPPNKRKIARTCEKLGEFDRALKLWSEMGDKKAAERCRKRGEKAGQKEFQFLPSD